VAWTRRTDAKDLEDMIAMSKRSLEITDQVIHRHGEALVKACLQRGDGGWCKA